MKDEILKRCSCGVVHTGFSQLQIIGSMGQDDFVLYLFNCKACNSTVSLTQKVYVGFLLNHTVRGSL